MTIEQGEPASAERVMRSTAEPSPALGSLPESGTPRSRAITFFFGAVVFAIPPPRAIAAGAGELAQMVVLLAAVGTPLIIILISTDWTHVAKLGRPVFDNVSHRRDELIEKLINTMVWFGWSVVLLTITKILFAWFSGKYWNLLFVCRPVDLLAGGVLFLSVSKARFLVTAIRHAGWDTWAKSIIEQQPSEKGP